MRRGRIRPGIIWIILAALSGGCAYNPPIELSELHSSGTAPVVVPDVPFFPQAEYQCGPAALATVLSASGVPISPSELTPQVFLPGRKGSLQPELTAAVRRHGRIPYVLPGSPAALAGELQAGRPVLVMQNLRVPGWPAWHFAVVTGMDTTANRILLNSGVVERLETPAPEFLRTWDWADRWALVVLAPGEIPANAEPLRYLRAVASFEEVAGRRAALPAWQAAARHWPDDPDPWLALGNSAYAMGDLDGAAQRYFEGLARRDDDPALSNNLATVLGELGCPRAGEALLGPVAAAQASDSDWSRILEKTLAELRARTGDDPVACASRWPPGTTGPPSDPDNGRAGH